VDQEARFRSLYEPQYPDLLAYFLRRLKHEDAVEAAADVFLAAWRRIDHAPDGQEARLWLFGIARNVLRNRQRTNRRVRRLLVRMATVPVNPPQNPEVLVVKRAQNCEVVAALDRLRSIDREVIQLRLWEEASYDDIAVLLGCSRHAAEQRYAKALRRLRSVYHQAGHEWTSGTQQTLQTQEWTREA